jgi:hypothetical protein
MSIISQQIGPDTFEVTVRDTDGETRHGVALTDTLLRELTGGKSSKEDCVRAVFHFLLDRGPRASIMPRFDVAMIETRFPDFREKLPHFFSPS